MYSRLLAQRAAENRPIRVGIVGSGKFGAGLVAQISQMQGMVTSVIADINLDRAANAYTASHIQPADLAVANSSAQIDDAIRRNQPAIVEDAACLTACDLVDVVVEATGVPEVGARVAYDAISHRKHVVMVNVEADVTIGAILRRQADAAGVVYSLVDGDQPGSTMNLVEFATTLGFEIVAAGRGTVYYAEDRDGTPDTVPQRFGFDAETLERRTINLKMYNTFRDGTKAQVEMTALANMAGLVPDVRGMHEPSANLQDIPKLFSLATEGGLLSRHGVVELANSVASDGHTLLPNPLSMGIFVVVRSEHPFTQEDLRYYNLYHGGENHNYMLYEPYHLVAVAAPISIAKAALYGAPTGSPRPTPTAEVITVAKRDLVAGELLDGGGGYSVNGICERADIARAENLLPLGLSAGARLKQNIAKGEAITYAQVDLVEDSFVLKLRRLQDAIVQKD